MWIFAVQKEFIPLQNGSFFNSILSLINFDFQSTKEPKLEQITVSNPLWHQKKDMTTKQINT